MASAESDYKKRDLLSGSLLRNIIRLSAPLAAGFLLHALYDLVDAFWLGKYSRVALGVPGVSMPLRFFTVSFGMGFASAGSALVAQYTGARNHAMASHVSGQLLVFLCVLGGVMALPIVVFTGGVLKLFNVPEEMIPMASGYLRIVLMGTPLVAFTIGYSAVLRALGDTITVVVLGALSNVINLLLDPVFIFGWKPLGIPKMGPQGAALATLLAQALFAAACLVFLLRRRAGLHITIADLKPDMPVIKKTLQVGLPTALGMSSNSIGFMVFQTMINTLGSTVIGAFTVGFRLVHFFHVPSRSLAMAAAPIVGQALGAQKPELADRAVKLSVWIMATLMLLPVVVLMTHGKFIARFFTDDAAIMAETAKFFLIVPISSYCFGMIMVLTAAFYGSGHTKPAMVLAFIRLWALRLPIAWFLGFAVGWKSSGIYAGMATGNIITAALTLYWFLKGTWRKAVIPVAQPPDPVTGEPRDGASE